MNDFQSFSFKEKLNEIFTERNNLFPLISSNLKQQNLFTKSNSGQIALENFLLSQDLQLYFPYKENFDWNELDEFSVTFDDSSSSLSEYEGFKFLDNHFSEITGINDDYLFNNPTLAIIPKDDDYLGQDVKVTINGVEHLLNPTLPLDSIYSFYRNVFGSNTSINNFHNNTNVQRIRLTQNVNPVSFFNDEHILTLFIPKVRITTRAWKRTLSPKHRTRIARAGADVSVNPNGGFSASPRTFYFDFDISASDLRNKRWKDVGIMFDPNWHKVKGSQQIIVWTKQKGNSHSKIQVSNQIKLDASGNYTPNSSYSLNFNVTSGVLAVFRGNSELDRNQILTTVVNGSEYDNAVFNHNSVNLSVRRVATHFEYFFDIFYTNL